MHIQHRLLSKVCFAVPNDGKRTAKEGHFARVRGLKSGIPDVFLACARGPFHGLFIEFKHGKNKATALQTEMMLKFTEQGLYVCHMLFAT